jgi:hypothetical protein
MTLHLFRDGDSDVFAFTVDRTGHNLPSTQESDWQFLETLDGVKFAWGEENFGEVYGALAAAGFYLFEGEMQPLPGADQKARRQRRRRTTSKQNR